MKAGKAGYQPLKKAQAIIRLRELGYQVQQQQNDIEMLLGVVTAQAGEIDNLTARVTEIENRKSTTVNR